MLSRAQISLFFQTVQKRIKRPETDLIAVPRQFLSHLESKDRPFHGVMKNVEADQARVEVTVLKAVIGIGFRYRHSIAIISIWALASAVKYP